MYVIKFMFDYGEDHTCLWAVNDAAHEKFGYIIKPKELSVTAELQKKIVDLSEEYQSSLNWKDPPAPSPWTRAQTEDFSLRATEVYNELVAQLGSEFEIRNMIEETVDDTQCIDD